MFVHPISRNEKGLDRDSNNIGKTEIHLGILLHIKYESQLSIQYEHLNITFVGKVVD